MLANVTDKAQIQLLVLAETFQMPTDQVIFQVRARMRFPSVFIWYIEPVLTYDSKTFDLWTVGQFRFAVEKVPSGFLVGATLDYRESLLTDQTLYAPLFYNGGKPAWPRGFAFEDQKLQNILT